MNLILAIYNRETFPNNILSFAKVGSKFCQTLNSAQKLPKTKKILPNGQKFRQKWSHCLLYCFYHLSTVNIVIRLG